MKRRKKPMGKRTPWVWAIEAVHGCNIRCWHCPARIYPQDEPKMMTMETWEALCDIMNAVTPHTRLELAQGGEPTLNPLLLDFLRVIRKRSPTTQVQVTTNGITLLNGDIKYRDLFGAGAHSVYVDMYGGLEKHLELVKKSGVRGLEWYKYDKPQTVMSNTGHLMANTYYNKPDMKLVILQDTPLDRLRWRKVGRLSTFLNHIDWKAAIPHGLVPVREPYKRKCTMPMRYANLNWKGDYVFCCVDFWGETSTEMGNVSAGIAGFKNYWFGRFLQSIRRRLVTADRASVPYCSRCNCAFSKCDWVKMWPEYSYSVYWNGNDWVEMPPPEKDDEVFKTGWGWHTETEKALPSVAQERTWIESSKKLIIKSTSAVDRDREKV